MDTGYIVSELSGAILKTINGGGIFTSVADSPSEHRITDNTLIQNYPNPFTETTTITWQLLKKAHVVLKVYDFTGRKVKTLVDCEQTKGEHKVNFDASNLPAGGYFCRLQAGGSVATKKILILR